MTAGSWLGEDAGVWGDVLGVGQGKPIIGLGGLPGLPGLPGEWPGLLTGLLGVNPDLMLMLMDALLRSLGGDSLDIDWSLAASRKSMLALCDVTTITTLKEIYPENNLNLQNKKKTQLSILIQYNDLCKCHLPTIFFQELIHDKHFIFTLYHMLVNWRIRRYTDNKLWKSLEPIKLV